MMDKGGKMDNAAPAPAANSAPQGFLAAEKVRTYFPETWLWDIYVLPPDSNGEIVIQLTAPDTITSFLASVFSVNPKYGLSVGKDEAEVIVFRELFVSLELPPYIIRYEDFCFTASVFSYFDGEIP
ncbi:unnamed protein product, partial [Candidula unifasciata]